MSRARRSVVSKTADLSIGRTGTVGPMLFQGAAGKRLRNRAASAVRKYPSGKLALGSDI